jgi:hypothetical protein
MPKYSEEDVERGKGCLHWLTVGCLSMIAIPFLLLAGLSLTIGIFEGIGFNKPTPSTSVVTPNPAMEKVIGQNQTKDDYYVARTDCDVAMSAAALVSSSQDTLEDTDKAFIACNSVQEFVEASKKYPDALDGANEQIYIDNRCQVPYLKKTPLCKSRQ